MAHSRIWQPYSPLFADVMEDGAEEIEHLREDLYERMAVDHIMGQPIANEPTNIDFDGYHKKLTMARQNSVLVPIFGGSINTPVEVNTLFTKANEDKDTESDLVVKNQFGVDTKIIEGGSIANKYWKANLKANSDTGESCVATAKMNAESSWSTNQNRVYVPGEFGSLNSITGMSGAQNMTGICFVQACLVPSGIFNYYKTHNGGSVDNRVGYMEIDFFGYKIRYEYIHYGSILPSLDISISLKKDGVVLTSKTLYKNSYAPKSSRDSADRYQTYDYLTPFTKKNWIPIPHPSLSWIGKIVAGETVDFCIDVTMNEVGGCGFVQSRLSSPLYYTIMKLAPIT